MKEAERSRSAFFVTLTYDNDHVPVSRNGFLTLDCSRVINGKYICSDVQLFLKRLRYFNKDNKKWPLKYYMCGEYGSESMRPHYHIILFNCELSNLLGPKYALQAEYGNLLLDGKDEFNCEKWPCGHITVGDFSQGSVGYTLKYISKDSQVGKFERDDRVREYSRMSKKLGDNYLKQDIKNYHLADALNRMYCTTDEGVKLPMPRYYKEKIYTQWQRLSIAYQMEKKARDEYNKKSVGDQLIEDQRNHNIRDHYSRKGGKDERKTSL